MGNSKTLKSISKIISNIYHTIQNIEDLKVDCGQAQFHLTEIKALLEILENEINDRNYSIKLIIRQMEHYSNERESGQMAKYLKELRRLVKGGEKAKNLSG